jgi:alkaline phosphatase D
VPENTTNDMKLKNYLLLLALFTGITTIAQNKTGLLSGPMLGQVELRSAVIWLEVAPTVKKAEIRYYETGTATPPQTMLYRGELGRSFNPIKFELNGLKAKHNLQLPVFTRQ